MYVVPEIPTLFTNVVYKNSLIAKERTMSKKIIYSLKRSCCQYPTPHIKKPYNVNTEFQNENIE
jgi:hypothetical protein